MYYNQKKKKKREYSNEEKICLTLYNYLRLDADGIREFLRQNPFILDVEPEEFLETLKGLCNRYLLSSYDVEYLISYYPEIVFNKSKFQDKENLFKEIFSCSEVAYGQVLKYNSHLLMAGNEKIIEFVNRIKRECDVTNTFVKNLFLKTRSVSVYVGDVFFNELNSKLKLLSIYGISSKDIENIPSICYKSLVNLDRKLKFALLLGIEKDDFLDHKYKLSKENIYSRIMANKKGVISIEDLYCSDNVLCMKTGYSSEELDNMFQYNKSIDDRLNSEFKRKFPELSQEIDDFFKNISVQSSEDCTELG